MAQRNRLLSFAAGWNPERHPALFVGFRGRGQVEIGKWNFFGVLRSEVPQGLADDGVVAYFLLVLVAEDQHRIGQDWRTFCFVRNRAPRHGARVQILVAVGLLLPHHLLLFSLLRQALPVHLGRFGDILVGVVVVRGIRIPEPVRIVPVGIVIAVRPWIVRAIVRAIATAPVTVAAVAVPIGAIAVSSETIMQEGTTRGAA